MFASDYARYYNTLNKDKPYKKEINFVYRWAEKPSWIFDIGCGTTNYWKYFPQGTYIRGIDQSPSMATSPNVIIGDVTKYKHDTMYQCATALFDVINYIPTHTWWKNIPIEKGRYFVFDIWNYIKATNDGFRTTFKRVGNISRVITPIAQDSKSVKLKIELSDLKHTYTEVHKMYLYSHDDIKKFCGRKFDIVDVLHTEKWATWYKLRKK